MLPSILGLPEVFCFLGFSLIQKAGCFLILAQPPKRVYLRIWKCPDGPLGGQAMTESRKIYSSPKLV